MKNVLFLIFFNIKFELFFLKKLILFVCFVVGRRMVTLLRSLDNIVDLNLESLSSL